MKKLTILLILINLVGCADFDFVYKENKTQEDFKNNIKILVSGDDADKVYDSMIAFAGDGNSPLYVLQVSSTRTDSATVVEKDATASKFSIKYKMVYDLYNLEKQCVVLNRSLSTESSYDAKSAGYSFGTDLSKNETALRALDKNINLFFGELNVFSDYNSCNG